MQNRRRTSVHAGHWYSSHLFNSLFMILSQHFILESQCWCCSAQLHAYTACSFLLVATVRSCKADWTRTNTRGGRKRRTDASLHSDVLLITDCNCTFWQPSLWGAFDLSVSGSVSVGVSGSVQSGTSFQPAGSHRCCVCFITNGETESMLCWLFNLADLLSINFRFKSALSPPSSTSQGRVHTESD